MQPGIHISRTWFDDDVIELQIVVSDGVSSFSNKVYVGPKVLEDAVASLRAFKAKVHGGLFNLRFGEFGPEYANGALYARFHFPDPGPLFVTTRQESRFFQFVNRDVASQATMYLKSYDTLLSRFVDELSAMADGTRETAYLEAVSRAGD